MNKKIIPKLIGSSFSYKTLCSILKEPYCSGNQKEKQLTEWDKIFKFNKNGTKYSIERLRTKKENDDLKLQGTYIELLKTLMYSYLNTLETNSLIITIPKLMEKMYLVNNNYSYGKYNTLEIYKLILDEKIKVKESELPTITEMDRFFISTETNYRKKIKQMLKEMEDDALISHPYEWLCFGRTVDDFTTISRATKNEYEQFLQIQSDELKNHLKEDGTPKSKSELDGNEQFIFYSNVLEQTKKQFKCSFYSYEYEIVINQKGISEHLIRNIHMLEKAINTKVIEQLKLKDNYLCLIDWFINKGTKLDMKKLLTENRKDNK